MLLYQRSRRPDRILNDILPVLFRKNLGIEVFTAGDKKVKVSLSQRYRQV